MMVDAYIDSIAESSRHLVELLVIILITAVALVAAYVVMRRWLWPVLQRSVYAPDRRVLSLIEQFVYLSLIIVGLRQSVLIVAPDIARIEDLFFLIYWALGIYFSLRLVSAAADWYLGRIAPRFEGTAHEKIVSIVKYIFFVIIGVLALIVLLDHFDITSSALTASVATLGLTTLIVGLAAENIINDVITGIVINADRPFQAGDRIEISELNTWGDVQEVGWRSTRILTRDKRMVTVPNSLIGQNLVTNYSVPNKVFRVETDVVVAYGENVEQIKGMIMEAVEEQDWVMKDRPIQVLLWEFRETGVLLRPGAGSRTMSTPGSWWTSSNTAIYRRLFDAGVVSRIDVTDVLLHRSNERQGGDK